MNAPFKFLDAYKKEDFNVFFGRDKETENLYNALSGVKHLLIYGPSGAGKTSLVECGLRNQFSDADWYALTIRKGDNINDSFFAAINTVLKEKMPLSETSAFSEAVEQLFYEKHQPVYLLFDQFEELLISGSIDEKKGFFSRLYQLVRFKIPCRILFIMREEFIGHLHEFESLFPTIFQQRFRLEKINGAHVQAIIESILEAPEYQPFFIVEDSQALAQKMLAKLPDKQKEIELAHVQVFLSELWNRAFNSKPQAAIPILHAGLIQENDSLEGVLDSFLQKELAHLDSSYGKRVPLEVLAAMISERHTKLQVTPEDIYTDLQTKSVTISEFNLLQLLLELEQRRIVRTLKSNERPHYEISHDILASLVGKNLTEEMRLREKANDIYKVYQEKRGYFSQDDLDYIRPYQAYRAYPADLEERIKDSENHIANEKAKELAHAQATAEREIALRQNAEKQQRIAKLRSYIAGTVAVVAVVFLVLAWCQYKKAEEQKKEAIKALKKSLQSDIQRLDNEIKNAENNLSIFKGNSAGNDLLNYEMQKRDSLQKQQQTFQEQFNNL
ncbi:ATP-binding protein [Runella sp. SP2]|uniref:ATP-binding protein n=1 Tax=Runella sp. SP2 TaxID=2268026 RepID=UPI000F091AD6|nr:AAA family ATPase [Runella sp. SP2]AYQ31571.1 hypothetical protein DTQ70_05000 [Runella sp. SP2]